MEPGNMAYSASMPPAFYRICSKLCQRSKLKFSLTGDSTRCFQQALTIHLDLPTILPHHRSHSPPANDKDTHVTYMNKKWQKTAPKSRSPGPLTYLMKDKVQFRGTGSTGVVGRLIKNPHSSCLPICEESLPRLAELMATNSEALHMC
ncbi:hypothetical protein CCH79_00010036 [Gambusia affinis]|uniref:Uncharacterized protein n=1 Tax=Gambusia affinis TaxID=33528 RepID=A0A315VZ36_GAMAF|nr:hypothetical protein CCH79_00010036 [Gambusia affinis]